MVIINLHFVKVRTSHNVVPHCKEDETQDI